MAITKQGASFPLRPQRLSAGIAALWRERVDGGRDAFFHDRTSQPLPRTTARAYGEVASRLEPSP